MSTKLATRRALVLGAPVAAAGLAANPAKDVYSRAEVDALVAGSPYRVPYVGVWPELRPVGSTRPVEFVGPDTVRDTVPAWVVNDIDTYLGY